MKKNIIFLIFVSLFMIITSCGKNEDVKDNNQQIAAENTSPETGDANEITDKTERFARIDPGLPDMDFDGYVFNILSWHVPECI